ncbi:A/G-specific adenine glycosylase [Jeotgalibacillus salarius]|uniref:Adenine DNA glycosylase n=1 Tax=Jeotgalibacillus salarius TaxID=546023 RepID=A0A4Y8LC44_9BACL|nr:A/G-specific adenine glycosylase [Jeotgalibacillus salarius]TFD99638.1 A/G-specific adenine glycosylase [Jeotgalibacillus salarius]
MNEELEKRLNQVNVKKFGEDLVQWFEQEMRDLPWRENKDPYRVWVSEIMLQQTRVDTVIPYYNHFMEQFPTVEALAHAPEDDVLKAWEGLGYYSRARNLQAAVREVHEAYEGIVPDNLKEISSLKGVGPYTAGAILSIAYGRPEPAVDGNVMRVLSRILTIWDDIAKPSSRKKFETAVRHLIYKENPSYFNQALMELGAIVCTPTSPSCFLCPVQAHCAAFEEGSQHELPVKSKKKAAKTVELLTVIAENNNGEVLVSQRPEQGLLANMWEFPSFEKSVKNIPDLQMTELLKSDYHIEAVITDEGWMYQDHIFTHLIWKMQVGRARVEEVESQLPENARWVTQSDIEKLAMPVSHRKIANQWKESIEKETKS